MDRSIQRGRTSAPYAYVIPHDQRHAGEAVALVNLFRAQGTTVSVATDTFTAIEAPRLVENGSNMRPTDPSPPPMLPADSVRADSIKRAGAKPKEVHVKAGDLIVRMDQPITGTVRTLLAKQSFGANEPPPYDDTGWTLDLLRHVIVYPIGDSAVLKKPMGEVTSDVVVTGDISSDSSAASGRVLIVRNSGDWRAAALPWRAGSSVAVAESAFAVGDQKFAAGTFIVSGATKERTAAISALGLGGLATSKSISVKRHTVAVPRIAIVHTWIETQNEGWVRFAFDQMGVPYTSISDQSLRKAGTLDKFDVVVFPHVNGSPSTLMNGRPMIGPPMPWKKSAETPNLGVWDETDDVRGGMGLPGASALRQFVERGGLLITEGGTSTYVVSLGFNPSLQLADARTLRAQGSILRAQQVTRSSPILYGYEDAPLFPVYFGGAPVLAVTPRDTLATDVNVDSTVLRQVEAMRAKVIVRFYPRPDSLLLSGLMAGGGELIGKAAVIDAPVGKGHVVLFAIRPLWRWESQGTFAMVLNAMANWDHLDNWVEAVVLRDLRCGGLALAFLAGHALYSVRLEGQDSGTVIPRFTGRVDSVDAKWIAGMNYDPFDTPLLWTSADTILVWHAEQYSSGDVGTGTCEGSGVFAVPIISGTARKVAVGRPACSAGLGRIDATSRWIVSSVRTLPNSSALVRVAVSDGRVDTLPTGCQVYADEPTWSPSGGAIAFKGLCAGRNQENWTLYLVGSDGSRLHGVPGEPGVDAASPAWSPDGSRLVYERSGKQGTEVAIVDTSGAHRRVLAKGDQPAWSPRGDWIAYLRLIRGEPTDCELRIVRTDGSGDRLIDRSAETTRWMRGFGYYREGMPMTSLVWSPDGEWIAFGRRFDRGTSIWRVNVRTGELRQVTRTAH